MKTEQRKMTRRTLAALALLSGSVIAPAVAVAQETVASLQSRIEASQVGATPDDRQSTLRASRRSELPHAWTPLPDKRLICRVVVSRR